MFKYLYIKTINITNIYGITYFLFIYFSHYQIIVKSNSGFNQKMITHYQYRHGSVAILVTEAQENDIEHCLSSLQQKEKISTLASKRLCQSRAVYNLLNEIAPQTTNLIIDKDLHGKPYFQDSHLQFSVSHSANMLAAIIANKRQVGIDIQHINPKVFRVLSKFLNKEEENIITTQSVTQATVSWSAKEALFKLYGKRGLSLKEHISLRPFVFNENGGTLQACLLPLRKSYCVHYRIINSNYVLAYVVGETE
jgi:4'-phosphopantetheinyl transferase